jgi:hypothetical protein
MFLLVCLLFAVLSTISGRIWLFQREEEGHARRFDYFRSSLMKSVESLIRFAFFSLSSLLARLIAVRPEIVVANPFHSIKQFDLFGTPQNIRVITR